MDKDSGQTSVDSMMEDTPANYDKQNQRFHQGGIPQGGFHGGSRGG
jgi:hypothetical protein